MKRHSFNLNEDGFLRGFTWPDYIMFCGMLISSLAIGVYYAFRSKQKANDEFLLGGRSMTCFPVSMSLVASYISAILVLGGPAESYYHNVGWWVGIGGSMSIPIVAFVFMPFLYKLRVTSVYEYLEMRYDSRWVRRMASSMFVIQTLLYEAVAIYAPALALAAVMNFPVWGSILTVAAIASLYTAIGGMKAVVWTDVLQLAVIIGGMVAIVIKGSIDVGGLGKVWEVALQHNRTGTNIIKFGFDLYERHTVVNILMGAVLGSLSTFACSQTSVQRYSSMKTLTHAKLVGFDVYERHTVANILLGAVLGKLSTFACSQTSVQRYSSMKSLTHAKLSLFMTIPVYTILYTLAAFTGLVIFATYEGCDPLAAGLITKKDQILPFFVMDHLSQAPGLPGLFVACILSGALSTISSAVSSQAAVTWEDWLSMIPSLAALSPTSQAKVTKLVALGYGTLAVGLAFLAGNLGGLLQTAHAFVGAVSGPLLAVFIMALFMPFSNPPGVYMALLLGTSAPLCVSFGASGLGLKAKLLPTSTDSCPVGLDIPPPKPPSISIHDIDYPEKLLGISYKHTVTLGFTVAIVTGILVSFLTGRRGGRRVKRSLVHPWVRWALPDDDDITSKVAQNSHINPIVPDDELNDKVTGKSRLNHKISDKRTIGLKDDHQSITKYNNRTESTRL